jgi:hypothetical protein
MRPGPITCPKCDAALPPVIYNRGQVESCPGCRSPVQVEVFPALFFPPALSQTGAQILVPGESSCFFHPQKKAVESCESCGRFLCALCDLNLQGRHLCPSCVESGQTKGKLNRLEAHRTLYDNLALITATIPVLMVWPTVITAPLAIFLVVRYWNSPSSIIPRSKARLILAAFFASVQILAWIALVIFLIA